MTKKRFLPSLFCILFLFFFNAVQAQNKIITGTVADDRGTPLNGASVTARNAKIAVATNASGSFSITVPVSTAYLIVSYVGYEPQEIAINKSSIVDVSLQPANSSLNAVVVVGYGTQRRRDITGSVSSVKGEVFKNQPTTNAIEALQGRIAGVNIVKSSGSPDATPSIIIRGLSSLNQPTLYTSLMVSGLMM